VAARSSIAAGSIVIWTQREVRRILDGWVKIILKTEWRMNASYSLRGAAAVELLFALGHSIRFTKPMPDPNQALARSAMQRYAFALMDANRTY
jgi:hypothetical protein